MRTYDQQEPRRTYEIPRKNGPKKQETFATVSWATEHPRQAQKQLSSTSVTSQENKTDRLVEVQVNGVTANYLVDTGACSTILSRSVWEQIQQV